MLVVPLKFMCSTQCETPVRPGPSSREPTRYQHQTETSGAVCTGWTMTLSPFARWVSRGETDAGGVSETDIRPLYRPDFRGSARPGGRISRRETVTTPMACGLHQSRLTCAAA